MYLVNKDLIQATLDLKRSILQSYYKYCDVKQCFSCERQKALDLINLQRLAEAMNKKEEERLAKKAKLQNQALIE